MTQTNTLVSAPALFTNARIGPLSLANRIMVSPMCQYSAVDGVPNDWHTHHYSTLALSGAGLLCIEATHISAQGRITAGCLGLWNDEQELAFTRLLLQLKRYSPNKLMVQLSHAGRKGSSNPPWEGGMLVHKEQANGWQTIGVSALSHRLDEPKPQLMQEEDFALVLEGFVQSAQRAVRAGFDAIELHCAHGYLLHQCLSPVANQRQDRWGGSLDARMSFPLAVFKAVRQVVPSHIAIGVRVSATDCLEHLPEVSSWTLSNTIAFVNAIKELGCDFVDVSTAGISPQQKIDLKPAYQLAYATAIKLACDIPTITVGMITEPDQANDIIQQGQADLVAMGRAFLYNPRWPWHAAQQLGATVPAIVQYARSLPAGKNRIFGNVMFGMR